MYVKQKCLHCPQQARTRGCCPSCYNGLRVKLVLAGRATWQDIEKAGKSLPTKRLKGKATHEDTVQGNA